MNQALPIIQLTAVNDFATNVARSGQSHVTIYGELLIQQETVNGQLGLHDQLKSVALWGQLFDIR